MHPLVRSVTVAAIEGLPEGDGGVYARSIAGWVADHTRFLPDPLHAEALHDPAWVVGQILTAGQVRLDCDDVAMLVAAMGLSIGLRARFTVIGFNFPNAPYRHVFAELADPRRPRWLAVDPTKPVQGLSQLRVTRQRSVEV
jgi:hypothetical protein